MLTGKDKAKVQHMSGLVERRDELMHKLANSKRYTKVGASRAESLSGDNMLTGVGMHLDDIAQTARYRLHKLSSQSCFADPQILSFAQFIPSRDAPVTAGRSTNELIGAALDAVEFYLADDYRVGIFVSDFRREGRVYVPTEQDYRVLVTCPEPAEEGAPEKVRRARDLALVVGKTKFNAATVEKSPGLSIARDAGRRFSHTYLVADLPVNQVYSELNDLTSDWNVAIGRKRHRHYTHEASERIHAFVEYFMPEADEVVEDLYLKISQFLSEPKSVAVMFSDYWHTDTGHFEKLCDRDRFSWAEFVPILAPEEEEKKDDGTASK